MDGVIFGRLETVEAINWLADNIQKTAEDLRSDWNFDAIASIVCLHPADQPISRIHRNCADTVFTEMLLNLNDEFVFNALNGLSWDSDRVENRWEFASGKINIDDGANNLDDSTFVH